MLALTLTLVQLVVGVGIAVISHVSFFSACGLDYFAASYAQILALRVAPATTHLVAWLS